MPSAKTTANVNITAVTSPTLQTSSPSSVLEYEILDRNGLTLQVKFLNPFWVGAEVDEEYTEEEGGKTVIKIRRVDKDPNQPVVKSINIPLALDGTVDRDTLRQIIHDQARGVLNRMSVTAAQAADPVEKDLDKLIGGIL